MYCKDSTLHSKLTRHLTRKHQHEQEVKEAMLLTGEERDSRFERIRLLGDYHHNKDVLTLKEGQLIVVRNPSTSQNGNTSSEAQHYSPCPHCFGFFKNSELWRHCKTCRHKTNGDSKKYKNIQSHSRLLLPSFFKEDQENLSKFVLTKMKNDEIAHIAREDELLLSFGSSVLEKVGKTKAQYVSQRMRQMARLILEMRKSIPAVSLTELIDTKYFDAMTKAIKVMCNFDEEEHLSVETPSLALKLGHSLKRCGQLLKSRSLRAKDDLKLKGAKRFLELFENEWATAISSRTLASMGEKRQNKIEYLPIAEDLKKLRCHLASEIEKLTSAIEETGSGPQKHHSTWIQLAKVTLARIIIFNKRRSGETSKLEIEKFKSRPDWKHCDSTIKSSLTPIERRLCER